MGLGMSEDISSIFWVLVGNGPCSSLNYYSPTCPEFIIHYNIDYAK